MHLIHTKWKYLFCLV